MGGCGGKKSREKKKAATGPGGKFDSIGGKSEQQENLALVTRLMGEVGSDGENMMPLNDRLFLQDVRIKLNQLGSRASFGWRQVEAMVRIHAQVRFAREAQSAKIP